MKGFNVVVGVLSIFGALYCIFWPEVAFLNAGWIVALVMFLWGLCAIINYAIDWKVFHRNDGDVTMGALGMAFGVSACVLSVLAAMNEVVEGVFLLLVLIVLMAFLLFMGINNLVNALRTRKSKGWVLGLIFGVVQILLALVGVLHWVITGGDDFTNILIGVILGAFGLTLIATIFSRDRLDLWGKL